MAKGRLYNPAAFEGGLQKSFALSRSKIELYFNCPRCFYLDVRFGVSRPSGPPFTINLAIDNLLKKEFDSFRISGEVHPLLNSFGLQFVGFDHPDLGSWRNPRKGVRCTHNSTGFEVYGAIDDLWVDPKSGQLIVADFKATAKASALSLDAPWQMSYKRQVEIYQWIFKALGYDVSSSAWFVYANGDVSAPSLDRKLHFNISLFEYSGSTLWVDDALKVIKAVLDSNEFPEPHEECPWCRYRFSLSHLELGHEPCLNGNGQRELGLL